MIGETAQLVVQLTLKDQLSQGVSKAEGQLGRLNTQTRASSGHMTVLASASNKVSKSIGGLGGALGHASGKIGGLLSGPLGLIGLTGGILSLGGAIESSVKKVEDFDLGLEKLQGVTGETSQAAGTLLLEFQKFGLSADRTAQIAGFAEKTLGKLADTTAKGAKTTKSAALTNLELVKAQRQAAGESTKTINKLITEQKGRDAVTAAQTKSAASVSKLVEIDKTYGLSLIDTKGKVVDFSTELGQVADLYDRNIPASTKAYVAAQLFGRGYAAMLPILKQGSAGIRDAAAQAKAFGLDLGGDTVAKMEQFRSTMRDLGQQVGILQLQIGLALVPAITDAAKAISTWLSNGGSQQILDFFKGAASFAQDFGKAVETFVVPAFSAISKAWGAIPGPLKTLLITGFIANKAGKFLFDKSLFGGLKNAAGSLLGKVPVVGGALDSMVGNVQHVWVDNPGFGTLTNVIPEVGTLIAGAAGISAAVVAGTAAALIAALTPAFLWDRAHPGQTFSDPDPSRPGGFNAQDRTKGQGWESRGFPGKRADDLVTILRSFPGKLADDLVKPTDQLAGIVKGLDKLHLDFADAVHALKHATDPEAMLAAAAQITKDMLGGVGSAGSTKGVVKELTTTRDALVASGNKEAAAIITGEIRKLEALEPGRAHQARLLAQGAKIVHSTESAKQKIADLTRIENELKSLHRTTAATAIQKQIDILNAINKIPPAILALKPGNTIVVNSQTGFTTGQTPLSPNTPHRVWTAAQNASNKRGSAAGFLGLTTGASDLGIAGEAGPEAVAIIKNPKPLKALTHAAAAARVFVTNWPGDVSRSSSTTAKATSALAQQATSAHGKTTRQKMAEALTAIQKRAIARGHHSDIGQLEDTYRHDRKLGISLERIIHAPPIHATVTVSTRDVNTAQNIRRRYGPTPTQAGAQ